jgi:hypothetical protein
MLPIPGHPRSFSEHTPLAIWNTRSGDLAHGNLYDANRSGVLLGDGCCPTVLIPNKKVTWQLSRWTLVVPVIVVTWSFDPAGDPWVHGRAKSTFDFDPWFFLPTDVTDKQVLDLVPNLADHAKPVPQMVGSSRGGVQIPPDRIFSQCGIQFQAVRTFVGTLPEDYKGVCSVQSAVPEWGTVTDVKTLIDRQVGSELGDLLFKVGSSTLLDPIVVQFGPILEVCDSITGFTCPCGAFDGKADLGRKIVYVSDISALSNTLAHELAHVVLNSPDHDTLPDNENNLLRDKGLGTRLRVGQCEAMRKNAIEYTKRLIKFNIAIGRVDSQQFPLTTQLPLPGGAPRVCCAPPDGIAPYRTTLDQCSWRQNLLSKDPTDPSLDESLCKVCCLFDSSPTVTFRDECPGASADDLTQCDQVCCDTAGNKSLTTRYQCSLGMGTVVQDPTCLPTLGCLITGGVTCTDATNCPACSDPKLVPFCDGMSHCCDCTSIQ